MKIGYRGIKSTKYIFTGDQIRRHLGVLCEITHLDFQDITLCRLKTSVRKGRRFLYPPAIILAICVII